MKAYSFTPQNNFPKTKNKPEQILLEKFLKAYKKNIRKIHSKSLKTKVLLSMEIPINSYGIADLIALSWNPKNGRRIKNVKKINNYSPTIRSFEVKINDWRSALRQAFRYRFFSNVAIILLPSKKLEIPITFLTQFKKLKVGLWGFDEKKQTIKKIYTPRFGRPLSQKHYKIALNKAISYAIN